jgi:RNA polymerase sigma-70 factor (ECF subfamily)
MIKGILQQDDNTLIQFAQKGDLDAFNRLVLNYQDLVYNQAVRIMGEEAAAQDATQEAFISAYRNIKKYRGGSFRAWLLRIVTNACYDELRRRRRHPSTPLEPQDEEGEDIESPQWSIDPGELPEEQIGRKDLENAIQHCLDELPFDFREVVILVDIHGLDYSEASQASGKPLGTIKSRLARARSRLRECLKGFGELLPQEFRLENEETK